MSSIGLFDVQGGANIKPTYQVTTPIFSDITIRLNTDYGSGKEFKIHTDHNSAKYPYIESVTLNGKPLAGPWFNAEDLFAGGKLEYKLAKEPNVEWGADLKDAPPSMSRE